MLDDPAWIRRGDPRGMAGVLSSLPEQLEEGLRRAADGLEGLPSPHRVTVVGMGGSAIVGDLAAAVSDRYGGPEVRVHREPGAPSGLGPEDLVVAVSYSGNTWETLRAYLAAVRDDVPALTVGSGGQLAEIAKARGGPHVPVPRGLPPRGALGYLLAPLLALLTRQVPSLEEDLRRGLEAAGEARAGWVPASPTGENRAKGLARALEGRTPVVYAPAPLAGVARRWQTQFNENAKLLAWHSAFTEAAHNEIVGWMEDDRRTAFAPVLLEAPREAPWTPFGEAIRGLLEEATEVVRVEPTQEGFLAGLLELVLLGDLASVYLALLRDVDPWPVAAIDRLKEKLAARGLGGPAGEGSAEGEI